jgi:hypothetical protein
MISEFVLSDLQSSADIENLEVPSLPKLVGDITQGGSDVNLDSCKTPEHPLQLIQSPLFLVELSPGFENAALRFSRYLP